MRLLILTQKVDINDSVLGFFHRWVIEFAKHCELVTVIALGVGEYHLPNNVRVFSLGKELREGSDLKNAEPRSVLDEKLQKVRYIINFYCIIWRERKNYDVVFVHMNPEYVVLGGLFWRLSGKRIALWYTHKSVDLKLRLASLFTGDIFTASRESFRINSKKVRIMGHGIDTDFFAPDASVVRGEHMLSVGRLMESKRHDLAIRTASLVGRELYIAGDGPERKTLERLTRSLGANVKFLGGLTQAKLRDEYYRASMLIHTSETGSLDKVVLEAMACGLPVITTSDALSGLPIVYVASTPDAISKAVTDISSVDLLEITDYVRNNHGLKVLIQRILSYYETSK